jgi:hypothetical protein
LFTSSFSPRFNDVHLVVDVGNKSVGGCDNEQERERSLVVDTDNGSAVKDEVEINFVIEEERRTGIFGVCDLIRS